MARKCVHETFTSKEQILWLSLKFQVARGTYHLHGRTRHSSWKIKWITTFHLESFRKCGSGGGGYNVCALLSLFPSCRGSLWASSQGQEKEGELANTSLEFEFQLQFPCGSRQLSCQISANQGEVEMSANVNKHWKTQAKGNDVVTVISTNQHFASTFLMQIFKLQRHSCKLSFLFPPCPREHAHRLL